MADKARRKQAEAPGKVLRIGIVQGGKVLHERLIKPGQHVTVGESPKNTFVFSAPGLPKRFTLFQAKGDRYSLQFIDKIDGKIAFKDAIVSLSKLRERGDATRRGSAYALPLDYKNRGKVVVGDVTVLFQFVAAPPESARMVTKQDFRPKLLDDDDPVFLGFLALFSALATVLMIYVYNTDPIEMVPLDEIPDRFVDVVIPPKDKAPEDEVVLEDEDADGPEVKKETEPKETEPKEKKEKKELSAEEKAAQEAKRLEKKKENLAQKSKLLAGLIGTRGENNNGSSVEDVFADSDGNFQNLQDALNDVGGIEVASEASMGVKGATDGSGRGDAGIGDLARGGGGDADVGSVATKAPTGKAALGSVDVASGENVDKVKTVIQKYKGQVKYCYDQRLKENPNISGRIAVEFSVASGRVSSVAIVENSTGDSALESCVKGKVRSWRFPSDVSEEAIYLPFSLSGSG